MQPRGPIPTPARQRAREGGFTLVEVLVALVIVAILAAAAMYAFRGSRTATYGKEARAAGASYAQAISQFQADHANRNPRAADVMPAPDLRGPKNLTGQPYLRSAPDSVTSGRVSVDFNCGANGGGTQAHIAYCPGADPQYELRIYRRTGGALVPDCAVTTAAAPSGAFGRC